MLFIADILAAFFIAFLLMRAVVYLAFRNPRPTAQDHWTRLASEYYTARFTVGLGIIVIPTDICLASLLLRCSIPFWIAGCAAFIGAYLAAYIIGRKISVAWMKSWIYSKLIRFLISPLNMLPYLLLVAIGVTMPAHFDWRSVLIVIFASVLLLSSRLGLTWHIYCRLGFYSRPGKRLADIVAKVSTDMNIPVSDVWLSSSLAQLSHFFANIIHIHEFSISFD